MFCHVCNRYVASSKGGDKATTCVSCLDKGYKYCNRCYEIKSLNEFGKDTLGRPRSTCKKCTAYKSAKSRRIKYNSDEAYRATRLSQNFNRKTCLAENYTPDEWHNKVAKYNFSCAYCGAVNNLTCDHVVPLSKGGRNIIDNVVPACLSCNSSKNATDVVEWYTKQTFFDKSKLVKIIGGGTCENN